MAYDVGAVAAELLLEAADLEDVYLSFFEEVDAAVVQYRAAIVQQNFGELREIFHALKGSSSNLRMVPLTDVVIQLEQAAKNNDLALIQTCLPVFEHQIKDIRLQVQAFYELLK